MAVTGGIGPNKPQPDYFEQSKTQYIPVQQLGLVKEKPVRGLLA